MSEKTTLTDYAPATRRNNRDKRTMECPLSQHKSTGVWYKRIRGRCVYFTKDRDASIALWYRYQNELMSGMRLKDCLANETKSEDDPDGLTIKNLCNLFLDAQEDRLASREIGEQHYSDMKRLLKGFVDWIGPGRLVDTITPLDLQKFKGALVKAGHSRHYVNNHRAATVAMYRWAWESDVIDKPMKLGKFTRVPPPKRPDREDDDQQSGTLERPKYLFSRAEILKLLEHADVQMRAMIWLGVNCGFGCTDVSDLRWTDMNLETAEVTDAALTERVRAYLPRGKTGVKRQPELWPETVAALRAVPRRGPRVFYTRTGLPWVRDDKVKHRHIDNVSKMFGLLTRKAGLKVPKGTGFYSLRRIVGTQAAKSGNAYAVQGALGHKDTRMASIYIQEVDSQAAEGLDAVRQWWDAAEADANG